MPTACAPTAGRVALEGGHRARCRLAALVAPSRAARQRVVQLLLAAEQAGPGDADLVEHDLGGVRGADAVLVELLALAQALRARRDDEGLACPRVRSSGSTTAVTTCTSAMPPLVAHVLVPLSTHSSVASSYTARVRIAPTSEPASGSEEQKARDLQVARASPNICGHPLADLLVGAVGDDAGGGERGADDREADAGVAPEELLHGDRDAEAGLVEALGREKSSE